MLLSGYMMAYMLVCVTDLSIPTITCVQVLDDDEFIIYLEEAFNLRMRYDDDDEGGRSTVRYC